MKRSSNIRTSFLFLSIASALIGLHFHPAAAQGDTEPSAMLKISCPTPMASLAFSSDSLTLAGGGKGRLFLWNSTGELVRELNAKTKVDAENTADESDPLNQTPAIDYWVTQVAFSPDNTLVAAAVLNSGIKVWEVKSGNLLHELFGHQHGTATIAFSPDGQTLASGGNDKKICLWDMKTGQTTRTLEAHFRNVTDVSFSPDGKTLTSLGMENNGRENCELKLWDLETGQIRQEIVLDDITLGAALSDDGKILADIVKEAGYFQVRLSDARSGAFVRVTTKGSENSGMGTVGISPDSRYAAAIGKHHKKVSLFSISTGKHLTMIRSSGLARTYAFSAKSDVLAVESRGVLSEANSSTIEIWPIPGPTPN